MTGRSKARLAVVALVLVVGAFVAALATSPAARVRYWAWRMRSGERDARKAARVKLLETGRPAIDGVLAEVVAEEVDDRIPAPLESGTDVMAFVGRIARGTNEGDGPSYVVEDGVADRIGLETWTNGGKKDAAWSLCEGNRELGRRVLVVVRVEPTHLPEEACFFELLVVALPEGDLGRGVVEQARARISAAHPRTPPRGLTR